MLPEPSLQSVLSWWVDQLTSRRASGTSYNRVNPPATVAAVLVARALARIYVGLNATLIIPSRSSCLVVLLLLVVRKTLLLLMHRRLRYATKSFDDDLVHQFFHGSHRSVFCLFQIFFHLRTWSVCVCYIARFSFNLISVRLETI